MIELISIAQGIIERGMLFSLLGAGVYIASDIVHFDNLAVEGAFSLGGGLTAVLLAAGVNPWLALLGGALIGTISGIVTGLLTTHLKLNNLISGIVVTTCAFSLTLVIAGSNKAVRTENTIFNSLLSAQFAPYHTLIALTLLTTACVSTLHWLLHTEVGMVLRAAGSAPQMVTNLGKRVNAYVMLGLALSNTLAALCGSLYVQYAGYFSIWTSVGMLVIGLAGKILGQTLQQGLGWGLIAGSVLYQLIVAVTFEFQINPDLNKLITGLLIVALMVVKQGMTQKRGYHVNS
ncbi:ABC transporter permease [Candidatus Dependentiae bacterium Noda2021]|nr:ABC transporter permease [Candidatus Dependentiae bacterium Noda2021]